MFGFIAYSHVPNKLRKKSYNKSKKYIFIGYESIQSKNLKGYYESSCYFYEDGI